MDHEVIEAAWAEAQPDQDGESRFWQVGRPIWIGNAHGPAVTRITVQQDLPAIRDIGARHHLGQRGLAGGIVADQPQAFAGADVQIHPAQRLVRPECLGDALQGQGRGVTCRGMVPLPELMDRCDHWNAAR